MVRATFHGFEIARSALQENQKRLDVVGQNIANMNVAGYTRQQLETVSASYTGKISGYMNGSEVSVGYGSKMTKVSQIRDPYLDKQYRAQMSRASYSDAMQTSLDELSKVLDTSNIEGMELALDSINKALSDMTDINSLNSDAHQTALRQAMSRFTDLLNQAATDITKAEQSEYERLDGTGTSELGAEQRVNEILRQIGDLNVKIKSNQIMGQQSLEMVDERNLLVDELSSFFPIEVTYYKDAQHSGKALDANGNEILDSNGRPQDLAYEYDTKGNLIGKKDWPDDMRIELLYTDADGNAQRLTMVNGSDRTSGRNYGEIAVSDLTDPPKYNEATVTFTAADSTVATGGTPVSTKASVANSQLDGGSIQASLDMLGKTGSPSDKGEPVRGYEYYMGRLDILAQEFAKKMNEINQIGVNGVETDDPSNPGKPYLLFVNRDKDDGDADNSDGDADGITAANIGISQNWSSGNTKIGQLGDTSKGDTSPNDTVLNMLQALNTKYNLDPAVATPTTFGDYAASTGTILASDSQSNKTALTTNVTTLNGIQDSRDSVSGISLDEEAANMMSYSSAYNAASRLMTTFDEMLNTLINSTGLVGR